MQIVVRAFVLVLALTGAVATASSNNTSSSSKPVITRTSGYPIPSCPPNDPNACGLNDGK